MKDRLKLVTWNINSVRLRMPIVEKLIDEVAPDVICLQETKCPDANFPENAIRKAGYEHIAINGQKGYHGVATLSRRPLSNVEKRDFDNRRAAHQGAHLRQRQASCRFPFAGRG